MRIDHTWDGRPVGPDEAVDLTLHWEQDGSLRVEVDAPYHGDPPPAVGPGSTWALWEHEVVELFLVGEGNPVPYLEVELGPHGHYLGLRLLGARNIVERELPLTFACAQEGGRWHGEAHVSVEHVPPRPLRVNAFAIHGEGDERRYLCATPLPGDAPDFHQPSRFPLLT